MNASPSRKYFDISPPGKTAANPTSKPVIAGRQPAQEDPLLYRSPLATLSSGDKTPPRTTSPAAAPAAAVPAAAPVTAAPEPAETVPAEPVDPQALLIQSGDFTPLKPSRSAGHHAALIALVCVLVLLCAASYWLVSTM